MRIFLAFLILSSQLAYGQLRNIVTSYPDSASVKLNGELQCYTPCKVNYYWRKAENGVVKFTIEKEGYKVWDKVLNEKPMDFDMFSRVYMDPAYEVYDLKETPLIAFDKMTISFPNGKELGQKKYLDGQVEKVKWEGSIRIGNDDIEKSFYEYTTHMGFNTPYTEYAELFSEEDDKNQLPRFYIGAKVLDLKINFDEKRGKDYGAGEMVGNTEMEFEWQVLDKRNSEVVYTFKNRKTYRYRLESYQQFGNEVEVFQLALIDFLEDEGFRSLLQNTEDLIPKKQDTIQREEVELKGVKLPSFKNVSELISYANPACVTIITDGGHGSGVVVSEDGLLLSAYHVVEGVNKIDVKFSSGLVLQADIVDHDVHNDIVLLKVKGKGFKYLPINDSDERSPLGSEVLTIGTPADLDLGQSISRGIISGQRKHEGNIYVQLDMAVSPGNSGGPLLNEQGEIIGIVQRKLIGEGIEGIGFAVPIKRVKEVFNIVTNP